MEKEPINSGNAAERISALGKISAEGPSGSGEVNNHIHTKYSFSPYFPAMAAYKACKAGLAAAGIVDHDSVSGCREFLDACTMLGLASTCGFEIRTNASGTSVEGRKINNPDSTNIMYIAVHGIPLQRIKEADNFLACIREHRNRRNYKMTEILNSIIEKKGLEPVDFKKEIFDMSLASEGGSITERHILFALVKKIINKTGRGIKLINYAKEILEIDISGRAEENLLDEENPFYEYDFLGVLKASFISRIYIQPDSNECISVFNAVDFANSINAIPAYAYLGDVGDSPTGDKKAEKFEDDYLDELMPELKRIGFKGITYMPPRNTIEQLKRLKKLCSEYGFVEISGVDINSARQSFNCPELKNPEFSNLIDATWALIAHEKTAGFNEKYALFNESSPLKNKGLSEKIKIYSEAGRKIDNRNPWDLEKITAELDKKAD
jgi:predicted metal-dependent phosphoesterase TrpH